MTGLVGVILKILFMLLVPAAVAGIVRAIDIATAKQSK